MESRPKEVQEVIDRKMVPSWNPDDFAAVMEYIEKLESRLAEVEGRKVVCRFEGESGDTDTLWSNSSDAISCFSELPGFAGFEAKKRYVITITEVEG